MARSRRASKRAEKAACEKVAAALFFTIDVHRSGYIHEALALPLWLLLARQDESSSSAMFVAGLKQRATPVSRKEWMALMAAVQAVVGEHSFHISALRDLRTNRFQLIGSLWHITESLSSALHIEPSGSDVVEALPVHLTHRSAKATPSMQSASCTWSGPLSTGADTMFSGPQTGFKLGCRSAASNGMGALSQQAVATSRVSADRWVDLDGKVSTEDPTAQVAPTHCDHIAEQTSSAVNGFIGHELQSVPNALSCSAPVLGAPSLAPSRCSSYSSPARRRPVSATGHSVTLSPILTHTPARGMAVSKIDNDHDAAVLRYTRDQQSKANLTIGVLKTSPSASHCAQQSSSSQPASPLLSAGQQLMGPCTHHAMEDETSFDEYCKSRVDFTRDELASCREDEPSQRSLPHYPMEDENSFNGHCQSKVDFTRDELASCREDEPSQRSLPHYPMEDENSFNGHCQSKVDFTRDEPASCGEDEPSQPFRTDYPMEDEDSFDGHCQSKVGFTRDQLGGSSKDEASLWLPHFSEEADTLDVEVRGDIDSHSYSSVEQQAEDDIISGTPVKSNKITARVELESIRQLVCMPDQTGILHSSVSAEGSSESNHPHGGPLTDDSSRNAFQQKQNAKLSEKMLSQQLARPSQEMSTLKPETVRNRSTGQLKLNPIPGVQASVMGAVKTVVASSKRIRQSVVASEMCSDSTSDSPKKVGLSSLEKELQATCLERMRKGGADSKFTRINRQLPPAVVTWKTEHKSARLRMGNIVEARKAFKAGDGALVACGQVGVVQDMRPDGSAEIAFDHSGIALEVLPRDFVHLDLQVVTHEVSMVNSRGRPSGLVLHCIVTHDHGEGFFDIICQDGQIGRHVHSTFLRQSPVAEYTDLGHLANAAPCRPFKSLKAKELFSLRMEELHDAQKGLGNSVRHRLPPAGYVRTASPRSLAVEPVVEGKAAGRDKKKTQSLAELAQDNAATTAKFVSNICPFMETCEKGLQSFVDTISFTAQDCVFDIGCGTGLILQRILGAFPCQGVGIEINISLARVAEQNLQRFAGRAKVIVDDIRKVDLSAATAVVSYFLPHSFHFIKDHLLENLRPGCVLLNYTYKVPGWRESHPPTNGVHRYVIGEHEPQADAKQGRNHKSLGDWGV